MGFPGRLPHLPLHDRDLFFSEVVEFVDEVVDLAVGGVDEALEVSLVVVGTGNGELLVQVEHLLDERHHPVVPHHVRRAVEVDRPDGELF
jgi:hypothetical protein